MMTIIQSCVYPSFSLCSEKELYFRGNQYTEIDIKNKKVIFSKSAKEGKAILYTSTYFNSISVGKWKKYTNIDELNLSLTFKGKIKISFYLDRLHFPPLLLDEEYLESNDISNDKIIPLTFWNKISTGMLSFSIEALDDTELYSFHYFTNCNIQQNVKLGIVITHFNRKNFVLPAIQRLKKELLEQPYYKDKVSLFVVDNSQNITEIQSDDKVTIIPNENLGGSGGFTRGLVTLMDAPDIEKYTHCLFMDDDASCEVDGIKRTIAFLQFSKDPSLAIAGAALQEDSPFMQSENGARFEGVCKVNKGGLDLRNIHSLLFNEDEERIDYGGWWFFAFPINVIKYLSYPFFVRGDDVSFSLKNNFHIITLNGINVWQADFGAKQNSTMHYLDTRSHIMHNLFDKEKNLLGAIKTTLFMSARYLLTSQYEHAETSILALEDVCRGKSFWVNNINMKDKRAELASISNVEKVVDLSSDTIGNTLPGNPRENRFNRIIRWATLNGILLPTSFFHKKTVWQHKGPGSLRQIYRYKKIMYIYWPSKQGFVVTHSKKKFFTLSYRYLKALYKFVTRYNELRIEYHDAYDELTSKEFWEKQFYSKENKE